MFHLDDYAHHTVSARLSEVLDEIGVNERMVMKGRRAFMLMETIHTIGDRVAGNNRTFYHLGSRSEGTTTLGLDSDFDSLICCNDFNVMQDWAEWKYGKVNLLMIQDETTTPGYCYLQLVKHDVPLPVTYGHSKYIVRDPRGRILLKNSFIIIGYEGNERHGPSLSLVKEGTADMDYVQAFPCESWPQSATGWLQQQGLGRWPTEDMRRYAVRNGCSVVAVGSKVSMNPDIEWRISTCLAERCLMFNLNMTQIRCYVLMKMIVKSHLKHLCENKLSSYMCKTVLLHCIENVEPNTWQEGNLYICLTYCFLQLQNCLMNENCPHFIIYENNLMAGQFSADMKYRLLQRLSQLIQRDGLGLLGIRIDDVGKRLQIKLNRIPQLMPYLKSPLAISETLSAFLYLNFSISISQTHQDMCILFKDDQKETILHHVYRIMHYSREGSRLEQRASRLLLPLLYTTLGSMLASDNIGLTNSVSPQALFWYKAGLNSDGLSSRLKLASAFYCSGDTERSEFLLRHITRHYNSGLFFPVCSCTFQPPLFNAGFSKICNEQNDDVILQNVAFCVRFSRSEINCVPIELQCEMFRSTEADMQQRVELDSWMDLAVVDPLPFLHFLRYKTYGQLQRYQEQEQALRGFVRTIETEPNLRHRETALNLLGQMMEEENRPKNALKCYMLSLQIRTRNNAARLHICRLLANM